MQRSGVYVCQHHRDGDSTTDTDDRLLSDDVQFAMLENSFREVGVNVILSN